MKKNSALPFLLLFTLSTLSFSSCRKIIDIIKGPADNDNPACQVTQIVTSQTNSPNWVLSISYDQWGNPSEAFQNFGRDSFLIHFRYDGQHRLTDYILTDRQNRYYGWHRYAYNGQKIVHDTVYSSNPPAENCHCDIDTISEPGKNYDAYLGLYFSDVAYDSQDRIIQDSVRYLIYPVDYKDYELEHTRNYTYDASGNLVISIFNPQPYDDKESIFRTNKIWMFLHRDYSVNNSRPAAGYNAAGLPVKFTGVNGDGAQVVSFLGCSLFNATIDYDCAE